MGALVSDVPDVAADRVPPERLARLALVEHDLLRALRCCRRVNPLPGQLGRQHHRSPVVNIDQAAIGVRGNDHEPMVICRFVIEARKLADGRA